MQRSRIAEQGEDASVPLLNRWRPATEGPAMLDPHGLHLWLIGLDREDSAFLPLLSADELARRERFSSRDGARRFAVARGATRKILSQYLDLEEENLEFAYGPLGKPEIQRPASDLQFNLSHAENRALLAVRTGSPVGVDLEPIRTRSNIRQVAERVFEQETVKRLSGLEGQDLLRAFFCCWTELEARVKTLGKGVFNTDTGALPCVGFQPAEDWIGAVASTTALPPLDNWRLFRFQ